MLRSSLLLVDSHVDHAPFGSTQNVPSRMNVTGRSENHRKALVPGLPNSGPGDVYNVESKDLPAQVVSFATGPFEQTTLQLLGSALE